MEDIQDKYEKIEVWDTPDTYFGGMEEPSWLVKGTAHLTTSVLEWKPGLSLIDFLQSIIDAIRRGQEAGGLNLEFQGFSYDQFGEMRTLINFVPFNGGVMLLPVVLK